MINSNRQQRPVDLYFFQYIFLRMAVTIMEAIKKLALTLSKCAPMSAVPGRRIYEADAKFREGSKVGLLLLEMQSEFTAGMQPPIFSHLV